MPPMAIRDDVQHANVTETIDRLMQINKLSRGQSDYLETLLELVEAYENRRHVIELTDLTGLATLNYFLDQAGVSGSDLARLLGAHVTLGSKILNGSRRLTWENAKTLGAHFKVSPALFMD
jgi:antitoxin component HigA of HigAB toxin-antitoxin module